MLNKPSLSRFTVHIVQRYRSPSTYPPQQQDTICCKYFSLTLLMMGKILPETRWADLIDQYITVACRWFIYITLPNWWCTVKQKSTS